MDESTEPHGRASLNEGTTGVTPSPEMGGTYSRARAYGLLKKRNVRLYMLGMLVSQVGTYMQVVAEGWLVYQLTNSAFSLGLVGFIAIIPLAPWALVAGALADRMSRRKLLAMALVGEAIPPLVLAVLTWTGNVQVWHVIVADIALGAMNPLDFSSRIALIYSVVDRDEVENGMGVAGSIMNLARIIGPALAGVLIAAVGVAGAFLFNGFSFLFVLFTLRHIKVPKRMLPVAQRASIAANLIEVLLFIFRNRNVLLMIMMMTVVSLFVLPYQTLLPVFARDILRAGPQGLGLLTAATGVGAVAGAFLLTGQPPMPARRRLAIAVGLTILLGPITAAFAFSQNFFLSVLLLVLVGGGFLALRVISFTYVQLHAGDEMRGRMASILQLITLGTVRLGGFFVGTVAVFTGAAMSIGLSALICLLFGLVALAFVLPQLRAEAPVWNLPKAID